MTEPQVTLASASVVKVLGEYDHSFKINSSDGFVILYGPNGVGKTRFLETINALSKLSGPSLSRLPFESARLEYSDGSTLSAQKNSNFDAESDANWQQAASVVVTLEIPNQEPID